MNILVKVIIFIDVLFILSACSKNNSDMIFVEGGEFKSQRSNYYKSNIVVKSFWIGKYEVTQREWQKVMGYNNSTLKGDDIPVDNVSWYECIAYCNAKSIQEGLTPYYTIDDTKMDPENKNPTERKDQDNINYDDMKWIVTINETANGYRLLTDAEWEYAATGGQKTQQYLYSGSDFATEVAICNEPNTKESVPYNLKPKPVGSKKPNELGIYDMSGSISEWCWDWLSDSIPDRFTYPKLPKKEKGYYRILRGGNYDDGLYACTVSYRFMLSPALGVWCCGFRVARSEK